MLFFSAIYFLKNDKKKPSEIKISTALIFKFFTAKDKTNE